MSIPVPIDPELLATYSGLISAAAPTLERLREFRAEDASEVPSVGGLTRGGRFQVHEQSVPGLADDPDVPLLICTPVDGPSNRPVIYHTHGGGFFSGDHRTGLDSFLDEAERFNATLVSVGYRLAPENPFPAQINDVHAGLLWLAAHASGLGIDADRIVAAGTSAGGGLTAALALTVRDTKGPRLLGQMLLCPMLDDRNDSPSIVQMAGRDIWDATWNGFGWSTLLGAARGDLRSRLTPRR